MFLAGGKKLRSSFHNPAKFFRIPRTTGGPIPQPLFTGHPWFDKIRASGGAVF